MNVIIIIVDKYFRFIFWVVISEKNSKLESIKNDISGIIRRIIDNSEDLENFEIETDDKNIITKFRDIFGIAKDEEESLSIRKIGNEILVKYENENSSYKFKIKIK